jgi:CIC family chloride channel protein
MQNLLNKYRRKLTSYEAVLAYSLLGVVGGLASGGVVIAFEYTIASLARVWGVGAGAEDFESLPHWMYFALPAAGATALGIAYHFLRPEDRETGIVHVLSRMHTHYGVLPWRNALVQFFGGAVALATGQSGGREGPGVHLGGAINSQLGQRLGLPNNSLRVLIACGTAGGIAAAFNTPLAGVIFAMEVIIAEYTVVGFIPVILAAVTASAASRAFSPGGAIFEIPRLALGSLTEIPLVILLGVICGVVMALFIRISKVASSRSGWPVTLRFALAGTITGALAMAVPEVLGVGYDTLNAALQGSVTVQALLVLALCKVVATAISCGVGMPIGLIGPSLLIGACIGGVMGTLGASLLPQQFTSDPTIYIVIGMAATMAAALNAPLAAILAAIELTHSIGIAMPAMLAIVAATLTNTGLFRQRSVHQTMLRQLQRLVPEDPLNQLLHRSDVTATMDTRVVRVPMQLQADDLMPLLESTPTWCLVERGSEDLYLVRGGELLGWLSENLGEGQSADLGEAGIRRWSISHVPLQATLRQAMDTMRNQTAEAVCVYERSAATGNRILHGVITREDIEKFSLSRL